MKGVVQARRRECAARSPEQSTYKSRYEVWGSTTLDFMQSVVGSSLDKLIWLNGRHCKSCTMLPGSFANKGQRNMPHRPLRMLILHGFAAVLLASSAAAEAMSVDINQFDCGVIRKDGDVLELDRRTTAGPVTTWFSCTGRSCLNRERIAAADGSTSEVFRHIYLPRGRSEYVSTWALYKQDKQAPSIHRSKVYPFVDCVNPQ